MVDNHNINIAENAKSEIKEAVMNALGILVANRFIPNEPLPAFMIEVPGDSTHGDFSCNVALVSAKTLKKNPRQLAEEICKLINNGSESGDYFKKIEIAGPGFINFYLNDKWFSDTVNIVLSEGANYGKTNYGAGKRVLVEFVSANPTGPMHIGNARGGALGDSIASVLEYAGYYTEREFYINDAGNQINKLGLSLDLRYREAMGETIEMPEDSYKGEDIVEHITNYIKTGENLMNISENERRKKLVEYALPINIKTLEEDLLKYRIKYNTWFRESILHENGAVNEVVELLKKNGYTYENDGAVWFKATEFGSEKDIVLVRSNGVPTYIVPDIAYHYNKFITRKFDVAVDVLGADHHGYVLRMNAALSALGIDKNKLSAVICQMVRLVRNGETVKLSKRSGKAITLSTLLDEIPTDAARFFFNLRDANTHLEFDLDLAIEESSKNPVYYVQYAHARICRIIEKLANENIVCRNIKNPRFTEKAEFDLIRKLSVLPNEINEAAKEFNPSRITRYVQELAQLFHKFYDTCKLKGEADEVLQSRLSLCISVKIVFKNMLDLLKVEAPEKM